MGDLDGYHTKKKKKKITLTQVQYLLEPVSTDR